ncbi:MAG: type II toxin-antitoxin system Phd/YefM family antitoxin [Cyanobacteria bacterium J06555_12]
MAIKMAIYSWYMSAEYSIAQARDRFTQLVQQAETGETVQITRRGKPVAVILSQDDYQRLKSKQTEFGEDLEAFREAHRIAELDIEPEQIFGDRDRTPGREVSF